VGDDGRHLLQDAASSSAYDFWSFEKYHRYQEQCYGPYGGSIVNIRWAYLPEGPTADADYTSVTLFPSSKLYCYRVNLSANTEWTRTDLATNTASLGGAIKTSGVLGINLDLTSKFSSSSTTGYDVFAILGSTAMYTCGDTSDHFKWNKVWEPRTNR
jgi:hypothetical protein